CGTSLWYDKIAKNIKPVKFDESKPFVSTHQKQIHLVTDTSWINFDALIGIDDDFYRILQKSEYIDERRRDGLCYALNYRISMLKEIMRQAQ
ncbi:MAG: excisionase, partial [Candidatus Ornithomonoglobus sp.]